MDSQVPARPRDDGSGEDPPHSHDLRWKWKEGVTCHMGKWRLRGRKEPCKAVQINMRTHMGNLSVNIFFLHHDNIIWTFS